MGQIADTATESSAQEDRCRLQRVLRRGLVIAGGGAKGAYSFGCLKALREANITFDAVAGTSAGALNAAIWAAGRIAEGERLWTQISPLTSYRLIGVIRLLPFGLAHGVASVFILFGMLLARADGKAVHAKLDRPLAAGMCFALFLYSLAVWHFIKGSTFFVPAIGGALALLDYYQIERGKGALFIFAAVVILEISMLGRFLDLLHSPTPWVQANGWIFTTILVFSAFAITASTVFGTLILGYLLERLFPNAFSSLPLRLSVSRFLRNSKFLCPTYVTLSKSERIFDPDNPSWVDALPDVNGSYPGRYSRYEPSPSYKWVPVYERLDLCKPWEEEDLLVGSAAIPFGVVAPVEVRYGLYVDGGLSDNLPIFPLLNHGLDEIFVLSLDHQVLITDRSERKRLLEIERLLRLAKRGLPGATWGGSELRVINNPPGVVPYSTISELPKIRVISPSRSLGGAFSLLRFELHYTKELIQQGYDETWERLTRWIAEGAILSGRSANVVPEYWGCTEADAL